VLFKFGDYANYESNVSTDVNGRHLVSSKAGELNILQFQANFNSQIQASEDDLKLNTLAI
jgi:hypothetical protein